MCIPAGTIQDFPAMRLCQNWEMDVIIILTEVLGKGVTWIGLNDSAGFHVCGFVRLNVCVFGCIRA